MVLLPVNEFVSIVRRTIRRMTSPDWKWSFTFRISWISMSAVVITLQVHELPNMSWMQRSRYLQERYRQTRSMIPCLVVASRNEWRNAHIYPHSDSTYFPYIARYHNLIGDRKLAALLTYIFTTHHNPSYHSTDALGQRHLKNIELGWTWDSTDTYLRLRWFQAVIKTCSESISKHSSRMHHIIDRFTYPYSPTEEELHD